MREKQGRERCKEGVRRQSWPVVHTIKIWTVAKAQDERSNEVWTQSCDLPFIPPSLTPHTHTTHTPHTHTTHHTPHTSLTKDVEKRPHYSELLAHPLILEYETKPVDIGLWYQEVCKTHGHP